MLVVWILTLACLAPMARSSESNVGRLVSQKGIDFLLDNEVSSSSAQHSAYDRLYQRPEWPGGESGITIAVGYDLGFESTFESDWEPILDEQDYQDLKAVCGLSGDAARRRLKEVRHIMISWHHAYRVFDQNQLPREYIKTARMFPGLQNLSLNAQSALLSLEYNRGTSLVGPSRTEMRTIRDMVPKVDYPGIAEQLRKMTRIWLGSTIEEDMTRRRYGEAELLLTPDLAQ